MIVWLDLETTGLDPKKDHILELGIIVTDDKLEVLGTFSMCVLPVGVAVVDVMRSCDPVVLGMHTKNGLWSALMQPIMEDPMLMQRPVGRRHVIEQLALQFLQGKLEPGAKPLLGGNTIGFDRAFLLEHMPALEAVFHYRSIDMSSVNELAKRFAPTIYSSRPRSGESSSHRALADAQNSLDTAVFYKGALFECAVSG